MRQFFKKFSVPGPESQQEVRNGEVDKMMDEWYTGEIKGVQRESMFDHKKNKKLKLLFTAFILFAIAVFISAVVVYFVIEGKYLPFQDSNNITENQGKLMIEAPLKVDSGDIITIAAVYQNIGKARLTDINLNLLYPDNFMFIESFPYAPQNFDKNYWKLPALEANSSGKLEIRGRILGKEREIKIVKASMFYKPTNFHSSFKQEAEVKFAVNKSLLDAEFDIPDNVLTKQAMGYTVRISNTSKVALQNIEARFFYPENFFIEKTSVELIQNSLLIDELMAGEKKEIRIEGRIDANAGELMEFRIEAGLRESAVFVLQNQAVRVVGVVDPKVAIETQIIDSDGIKFGDTAIFRIQINNMSTLVLDNAVIEIFVNDLEDVLLWNTFKLFDDYNYEVISEGQGMNKGERKIRVINLPQMKPADEIDLTASLDVIDVPFDIGADNFRVELKPVFSADSPDLSIPLEISGESFMIVIGR